jgi:transaldolase
MVNIFLDGADAILQNANNDEIDGYTTNPTLLLKAGVVSYEAFAREVLMKITEKPVAFEVLSDDFEEMYRQAKLISSWGPNVNVKIPITNTKGESSLDLIKMLIKEGVTVNVTAITMIKQIIPLLPALSIAKRAFVSIFAGRIADTGTDPEPIMCKALYLLRDIPNPNIRLIWASAREIYNVQQAWSIDCDIITLSSDLYKKLPLLNKKLEEMSLDTVKMFVNDGKAFKL